jgi:Glycosyltransferase family 87
LQSTWRNCRRGAWCATRRRAHTRIDDRGPSVAARAAPCQAASGVWDWDSRPRWGLGLLASSIRAAFLHLGDIDFAVIVWRELQLPRSFAAVTAALAAAGFTTGLPLGFEEGQLMGVLTLCATAAWRAARREQWAVAGVLLGLLISIKPFFACLLIVPIWRRRRWPLILWTAAAASAALAAGIAVAGPDSYRRWLDVGRQVSWFTNPLNASLMGLLSRAGLGWRRWLPLAALVGAITLAAVRRDEDLDLDWLLCGTC